LTNFTLVYDPILTTYRVLSEIRLTSFKSYSSLDMISKHLS